MAIQIAPRSIASALWAAGAVSQPGKGFEQRIKTLRSSLDLREGLCSTSLGRDQARQCLKKNRIRRCMDETGHNEGSGVVLCKGQLSLFSGGKMMGLANFFLTVLACPFASPGTTTAGSHPAVSAPLHPCTVPWHLHRLGTDGHPGCRCWHCSQICPHEMPSSLRLLEEGLLGVGMWVDLSKPPLGWVSRCFL